MKTGRGFRKHKSREENKRCCGNDWKKSANDAQTKTDPAKNENE
jgi:hypothetical protein